MAGVTTTRGTPLQGRSIRKFETTAVDLQLQSEQAQAHLIIPQIPQTNQILMYHWLNKALF